VLAKLNKLPGPEGKSFIEEVGEVTLRILEGTRGDATTAGTGSASKQRST
jgi:hypothetical protein